MAASTSWVSPSRLKFKKPTMARPTQSNIPSVPAWNTTRRILHAYNVLLGLLGNTLVDTRLAEPPFQPAPDAGGPNNNWFKETSHNVSDPFLVYWNSNGGLSVFGFPAQKLLMNERYRRQDI